jgi:3-oxoadipate enol-lactonase
VETTERVRMGDGPTLAVTVTGAGTPLVLIPGLGSSRHVYAPIVDRLAERHRVIVYDPRGIGGSDLAPPPYSMERLAADCVEVAHGVGSDRFHLFGASMGGMVAEHVAVLHPGSVDRLILAATGPGRYGPAQPAPGVNEALLGRGARTPEDAYRRACTVLYSERFQRLHPEFIEAEVRHRAAHPVAPAAFSAQLRASRGADISARLNEIARPALVLHGTEDPLMPLENARALARSIPGAAHHFFEGCGHLFFHEEPHRTVSVMLSFLV